MQAEGSHVPGAHGGLQLQVAGALWQRLPFSPVQPGFIGSSLLKADISNHATF